MNKKERKAFAAHAQVLKDIAAIKIERPKTTSVPSCDQSHDRQQQTTPKPAPVTLPTPTYNGGICTEGRARKIEKGKYKVEVKQLGKWVEVERSFKSVTKAEEWIAAHVQ